MRCLCNLSIHPSGWQSNSHNKPERSGKITRPMGKTCTNNKKGKKKTSQRANSHLPVVSFNIKPLRVPMSFPSWIQLRSFFPCSTCNVHSTSNSCREWLSDRQLSAVGSAWSRHVFDRTFTYIGAAGLRDRADSNDIVLLMFPSADFWFVWKC